MLPSWTDREKKLVVALCVAVLCLLTVILVKGEIWFAKESSTFPAVNGLSQQPQSWSDQKEKAQATPPKRQENNSVLIIDVKGAVKKPGIYQLKKPARMYQVIEAAGGSTSDADLSKCNLAQEVTDGSVIYIPRIGEKIPTTFFTSTGDGTNSSKDKNGKIFINTASAQELEKLPGIGSAKAEAIIQYREEHGPFQEKSDVAKVPGIGEKLLERFQDLIVVP